MLRVCEAVDFMVQGSLQRILRSVVLRCDQCEKAVAWLAWGPPPKNGVVQPCL